MGTKISRAVYRDISFWGLTIKDLIFVVIILAFGSLLKVEGPYLLVILVVGFVTVKLVSRHREKLGRVLSFKVSPAMISIERKHPLCRLAREYAKREI